MSSKFSHAARDRSPLTSQDQLLHLTALVHRHTPTAVAVLHPHARLVQTPAERDVIPAQRVVFQIFRNGSSNTFSANSPSNKPTWPNASLKPVTAGSSRQRNASATTSASASGLASPSSSTPV